MVSATSERYAYLTAPGRLVTRVPGRAPREYGVPATCSPAAITSGLVALSCPVPQRGMVPVVLRLADGRLSPVPVSTTTTFAYHHTLAIGQRRLHVTASTNPFDAGPRALTTEALVDHRTGRVVRLDRTDPFGVMRHPDLDRSRPARRLCRPIRRRRARGAINDMTRYAAVARVGSWVLQGGQLQRCGSKAVKRFPAGYQPRLGDAAIAHVRTNDRRQFVYRDLRSRRTWTARWRGDAPVIGMTPRRLVISQPGRDDDSEVTIYETTRERTR